MRFEQVWFRYARRASWTLTAVDAVLQPGQTIVVLGAAGGVGSTLVQLARHAGIRVIGTAGRSTQERVRQLGAIPVDYRSEDVPARVREIAPDGVAAVFDHVGGPGIVRCVHVVPFHSQVSPSGPVAPAPPNRTTSWRIGS